MDFEQQWAVALKKGKIKQNISLETQRDTVVDKIKYKKQLLLDAINNKKTAEIENLINELINIRASLCILNLAILKKEKIYLDDETAEKEVNSYLTDCKTLALAVNQLV